MVAIIYLPTPAGGAGAFAGPAPARVERVVDGDTVRVEAQIWIDQAISIAVRVDGIDAPELFRPKCAAERERARAAKAFVEDFFRTGEASLHNIRNGKYAGRVVASIQNERGTDLARALVAAGHAVDGDRGRWCE